MIEKIKKIIWNILIKLRIGGVVQLFLASGLRDDGWFESFNTKRSIDKNGDPIPWCTYPFIKFIEPRLTKDFIVFEYGSGNSTLWYSSRVKEITAVENDKEWFDTVSKKLLSNASVIYRNLDYDREYCKAVVTTGKKFHLIIIDGRDRVNCVKNSINSLYDDGVVVFDNSDLSKYSDATHFLFNLGYKKIDFWGLSPVTGHNNCTSIFYKNNNCLNI
ncbi:MAG: hypothetical protein LC122_04105 [Chitinophagales bacterium]|nr:hypothetical protein [Chitinophagales bacterium]GIK23441.1 MAG: hypothetical protein BroJett005_28550 [Ignavibacteriota bacterium]